MKTETIFQCYIDRIDQRIKLNGSGEPKIAYISTKIRPSTKRRIEAMADKLGIKKSTLICEAIEMYLEVIGEE